MSDKKILSGEELGIDFQYPLDYKNFINNKELNLKLKETPWWVMGLANKSFYSSYELLNIERHSSKTLIPFAKEDDSMILACFDLSHKVWLASCVEDNISNADWNTRFHLKDFTTWLNWVFETYN